MTCLRSQTFVHLDESATMEPSLNSKLRVGCLDLGGWPNRISLFLTAAQARKLSQIAGQLADMIEDANEGERQRLEEVDGMCDLGGEPIPYVPPV